MDKLIQPYAESWLYIGALMALYLVGVETGALNKYNVVAYSALWTAFIITAILVMPGLEPAQPIALLP